MTTQPRSAYLAGPMRGHEDFNFPAFYEAAAALREAGWEIFSPAERDDEDPTIESIESLREKGHDWSGTHDFAYFMSHDLKAVCEMDAVICLPGWEQSQGARLETMVATEVNHPVYQYAPPLDGPNPTLTQIDPGYITRVFAERGNTLREEEPATRSALPSGSADRKAIPITTGVLDYFPAALVEVAKVSKAGNDKHNPGQPLHHARGKSMDHADSLLRHLIDRGAVDEETGVRHSAEVAWRALALLQEELEDAGLAPLARGARR